MVLPLAVLSVKGLGAHGGCYLCAEWCFFPKEPGRLSAQSDASSLRSLEALCAECSFSLRSLEALCEACLLRTTPRPYTLYTCSIVPGYIPLYIHLPGIPCIQPVSISTTVHTVRGSVHREGGLGSKRFRSLGGRS